LIPLPETAALRFWSVSIPIERLCAIAVGLAVASCGSSNIVAPQSSNEPASVAIPAPPADTSCGQFVGTWSTSYSHPPTCAPGQGTATVSQQACRLTAVVDNLGAFTLDVNQAAGAAYVQLPPSCATADTSVVLGRLEVRSANEVLVLFGNGTACCRHGALTLRR
jgi:hypothetical protein